MTRPSAAAIAAAVAMQNGDLDPYDRDDAEAELFAAEGLVYYDADRDELVAP